ncbi:MAG: PspC domain-containing protein [Bacteroidia bacterium]
MNKTVTVNIGGIVFHIDENAYERFKQYLEAIRSHFTTAEGRDEIMQDIESRIAEMFQERVKDSKQVITLEDVEEVTIQMGRPDQFGDESAREEPSHAERAAVTEGPVKRRLFRNPDDKLLGGVCSGIANYFDIDAVWVRLAFAFVFFVFGSGFLLYILLWIIVPEAKTTAEKLQMKGEPVTISNIEKNVKEEMEQVKKNTSDSGKKAGTVVGRIFEAIGEVIKFFFILLGKLIAIFFMFIGIVVAFAAFISLLALLKIPGTHYPAIWHYAFASETHFVLGFIGVVLLVGIPFLMLAYAGARMLFNIKKSSRIVGFTALGLWLTGVGICLVIGIRLAGEFSEKESVRKEISLVTPASKIMTVEMNGSKNEEKKYDESEYDEDEDFYLNINDNRFFSQKVKLDIVKSPNDSFQLVEILYARGNSRKNAIDNASHIIYTFTQNEGTLKLDRHFTLNQDEKYRAQKIQLLLRVPVGAKVKLDESLKPYIYDIDNIENVLDRDMLNRTWIMTDRGLHCVDCDGTESTLGGEEIHINGDDGSQIHIDENGIIINGSEGDKVKVDSMGISIHEHGKDRILINKKGMKVRIGNEEKPATEPPPPPKAPEEKGKTQLQSMIY